MYREANIKFVSGGEYLGVALRQRVAHDGLALVGTEDDAEGRVLPVLGQFPRVVIDIHLHLPDVLVRQVADLQVQQDEAAREPVVKPNGISRLHDG